MTAKPVWPSLLALVATAVVLDLWLVELWPWPLVRLELRKHDPLPG